MKGHILCLLAGRTEILQMKKLNFPFHTLYYLCILTVKIRMSWNIKGNKAILQIMSVWGNPSCCNLNKP